MQKKSHMVTHGLNMKAVTFINSMLESKLETAVLRVTNDTLMDADAGDSFI